MNERRPDHWFAAKRYGYGWGLPVRREGWVVLVAYAVLLLAGIFLFRSALGEKGLVIYIVALTGVLVAVIAAKGERPLRWRWGDD
jgi:hypothetical protein